MEVVFSEQAKVLINEMPDFDRKAFTEWWWEQQRQVGSQNILQWLLHQHRKDDIEVKKS